MSYLVPDCTPLDRRPDGFSVEALAGVLEPAWIHEAIAKRPRSGERVRQLPPRLTLWIVVLLGLFRRHSYVNLLGMLFEAGRNRRLWRTRGAPPSTSALSKARDRLGVAPVRHVFEKSARKWTEATDGLFFYGRRVFAIDGSTLRVPDTSENHEHFGRPGASRGHASHPQLRVVTLRDVGTRLCRGVRFGPYRRGELTLAKPLVEGLEPGDLMILDRNFVSFALLWDAYDRGADFIVRAKQKLRVEVLEEMAPDDEIVRIRPSRDLKRRRPDLPNELILRRITYCPQGSDEDIVLLTTLMVAEEIPGYEIAALYPERWEEETGYDELKTHLTTTTTVTQPTAIRSKTPGRVEQELYGLLIAYNAMRATIALAAPRAQMQCTLPARRISFIHALERIREAVRDMMQVATTRLIDRYEQLLDAIARAIVPFRPGRRYPRAVKRKMSNYPLKPPPDHALRA